MELRQLNYFVKAAETENFSIAAMECFVVQSTLSQQIRQLEDDLGVQLFER
ncbi:MAG: LysR family transcriptional regulator, partial [Prevotella sp.]|nr:LysR family transcriptional regulator [Prevotella sp.]